MFVRGSGIGNEYRRVDNSFYRGIVVKNNDPVKLNRVKVYIPELTNQPYDDWFEKFENFILKSPGTNSNPKTESEKKTNGDWEDTKLFEEVCKGIPWAEQCSPLMGESGSFRYYKDGEISTISDCNYVDGFEVINTETPSIENGSFSPAYLYENLETVLGDAFSRPLDNFTVKCNPYSFSYRPSKYVNKSKGLFSVPEVGSKVWVFHYEGDLNFPIYFGIYRDYREISMINNSDNDEKISSKYPLEFEN
jgi:hypothetical protein